MQVLKIGCYLLLSTAFVTGNGCGKAAPTQNNVVVIEIKDCDAPDTTVNNGAVVKWIVKDPLPRPSYSVHFTAAAPPTTTPFLVRTTVGTLHTMKVQPPCSAANPGACDYKYSLTKNDDGQPCKDPVIRIVP